MNEQNAIKHFGCGFIFLLFEIMNKYSECVCVWVYVCLNVFFKRFLPWNALTKRL